MICASFALVLGGCTEPGSYDEIGSVQSSVATTNGLSSINGLSTANGLSSMNGLSTANGLSSINGLSSMNGLMTTAAGRSTVEYLVRCALPAGQTLVKQDQYGASYTFNGALGMGAGWKDGACDTSCQEAVSACMIAHINTAGVHIPLWVVAQNASVGWGLDENYPNQEGSFFGNIFTLGAHGTDPTKVAAYYCHGNAWDVGVVPGRIGANQTNAPYVNAFASGSGYCKDYCTASDYPYSQSGFKACNGWNNTITTYRQAGGTGATGGVVGSTGTGGNLSATIVTYDQYTGGYCANVNIKNNGTVATSSWTVAYDVGAATHKWAWRATETVSGSVHTAKNTPDNASIKPGATVHFGFCANTGTGAAPTIRSVSAL